jgi:NitT/TauT family transport system substrate-binding protein
MKEEEEMRLSKLVVIAIVSVLLVFCAVASQAQQVPKIRVAWVVPQGNWASVLWEKRDLMRHVGKTYNVETIRFQGTPMMITALAAGELDVANLAYSSFSLAIQNANMDDLRVIADEAQDGVGRTYSVEFFVLKSGPIKKVEDLKGKVVATVGAGSAVDIALRAMLRKHGLEEKRDYTMVEAGFPNMKAMLVEKKVDLVPGVLPFSFALAEVGNTLFTAKDALGGPTQFVVWTARAGFLEKNRAAMVDFMEDAIRSARFFLDPKNHTEAVDIAARVAKLPPSAFQDYAFTEKDVYKDPSMLPNLDTLQRAIDTQQQLGFLKAKIDVMKHADLSIVKEAAARIK